MYCSTKFCVRYLFVQSLNKNTESLKQFSASELSCVIFFFFHEKKKKKEFAAVLVKDSVNAFAVNRLQTISYENGVMTCEKCSLATKCWADVAVDRRQHHCIVNIYIIGCKCLTKGSRFEPPNEKLERRQQADFGVFGGRGQRRQRSELSSYQADCQDRAEDGNERQEIKKKQSSRL